MKLSETIICLKGGVDAPKIFNRFKQVDFEEERNRITKEFRKLGLATFLFDEFHQQTSQQKLQQQEEYDLLIATRRERVAYFYENDLVSVGSKASQDKLAEDNAIVEDEED